MGCVNLDLMLEFDSSNERKGQEWADQDLVGQWKLQRSWSFAKTADIREEFFGFLHALRNQITIEALLSSFCHLILDFQKYRNDGSIFDTIETDEDSGYIRKLDQIEFCDNRNDPQWYVLQHPVLNSKTLGKVKRVCNAASKFKIFSVNKL